MFSTLNSRMSKNMFFGVKNYVMPKRALVQLLHGEMNLDLINRTPKSYGQSSILKWKKLVWDLYIDLFVYTPLGNSSS